MKNQKLNHILLWVFAIVAGLILNSCSARKSEKSKSTEESKSVVKENVTTDKKEALKTNEESNIKKTSTTKIDNKNKTVVEENAIEPINPDKPANYVDPDGKKHVLNNAKIKNTKTTTQNNIKTEAKKDLEIFRKAELAYQNKLKQKLESIKKEQQKKLELDKISERKGFNFLWLLLLMPLVFIVYLVWQNKTKIKSLISWPWWI